MAGGRTFLLAVLLLLLCCFSYQQTSRQHAVSNISEAEVISEAEADESHIQNPLVVTSRSYKLRASTAFRGPLKCDINGTMTKLLSWGHDGSDEYASKLMPLAQLLTDYSSLHSTIMQSWHNGTNVSRSIHFALD